MFGSIISYIGRFLNRRRERQEQRDRRSLTRGRSKREPIIQIDRCYRPRWIVMFSWFILLAWPCYGIWVHIAYPAIYGRSYHERYFETQYPDLFPGEADQEIVGGSEQHPRAKAAADSTERGIR